MAEDKSKEITLVLTENEILDILGWAYRCDSEGHVTEEEWKLVEKLRKISGW